MYVLKNGKFYTENGVVTGYMIIDDSKIHSLFPGLYDGDLDGIDLDGRHVLPGFIDIHIHGGYGHDVMDGDAERLALMAKGLLSEGTTSFLATTMTQSNEAIERALTAVKTYQESGKLGAEVIGVHLEGPFINDVKIGAQNPKFVQAPSSKVLAEFQRVSDNAIKVVTLAPEIEGAQEMMQEHPNVIFSIGHSNATYEETMVSIQHGVRHATHLYNGSSPFTHREPGVVGAVLLSDDVHTEVIVDGVHSHPAAVNLAMMQKGVEKFYLITDAMRAKGMVDDSYDLGGQTVFVQGNEARLADGTLAGSVLRMNDGLRNLINYTHMPLEYLWKVTSFNQAKALGLQTKGRLTSGMDADLAILNTDLEVDLTIKNGEVVYQRQ